MAQKFAVSFNVLGKVSSWGPVIEQNKVAVRIVSQTTKEEECWPKGQVNLFVSECVASAFFYEESHRQAIKRARESVVIASTA